MPKRIFVIFDTIRDLNAYDKQGTKLGKVHGGTKDPYSNDNDWNEHNALVFVDEEEVLMTEIYFDKKEVETEIFNLTSKINSLQKTIDNESNEFVKNVWENKINHLKRMEKMMKTFVATKVIG